MRVTFDNGGSAFVDELKERVERRLAERSVQIKARILLYSKAPVGVLLMMVGWSLLMFSEPGIILATLEGLGLALGALIIAFSLQHDANHGAYTPKRSWNHLLGWSTDVLLGVSSFAWRVKHNVAHHTFTNVVGYDDDITQTPLAQFTPNDAPRPWYRYQHLYIWPLYGMMTMRWQFLGDYTAFRRGNVGESRLKMPKGWNLAGLYAGKLVYVTWALVIPLMVYPWWKVAIAYVTLSMLISIVMAVTFQLAHCVDEADFPSAEELASGPRKPWAVHEVETTVDFCPRNPVLTWLLGGLNFQIEHHLFPRVPHTFYPSIASIVRETCERHGVRYTVQPNLWVALRSHVSHLREMGRMGRAAEIEMG